MAKVAAVHESSVVGVWNVASKNHMFSFRAERNAIWSLAWNRTGTQLAVGLSE
jgi:hypothetical protein